MNIRKANHNDADTIIGFQQKMAMETEGMELDDSIIGPGVRSVFDDNAKGTYYVAEENSNVIASLMITSEWSDWRNSYIWWFQSVYLLPEFRRMGVFRKMYEYIKSLAIENGIPGLRLYVEKDNLKAQKTYESLGMDGEHYKFYEWMK